MRSIIEIKRFILTRFEKFGFFKPLSYYPWGSSNFVNPFGQLSKHMSKENYYIDDDVTPKLQKRWKMNWIKDVELHRKNVVKDMELHLKNVVKVMELNRKNVVKDMELNCKNVVKDL